MPASPRATGPVSAASPGAQGVVQGGAEQRAEHPVGGLDARRTQQLHGLGDQGDQVVGAEGEGRVVERAGLLGDPLGLAAHLDDQRLGGQPQLLGRGDPEGAAGEPLHVHGSAGERHHGVQRQRQRAGPQRGVQHLRAVPAGGVHEQLSRPHGAGLGEPLDQARQRVVGDGQQHQLGARQHLGGRHQRHVGQQLRRRGARRRRRRRRRRPGGARRAAATAASAGPTRPAPTTPTVSRAGRSLRVWLLGL